MEIFLKKVYFLLLLFPLLGGVSCSDSDNSSQGGGASSAGLIEQKPIEDLPDTTKTPDEEPVVVPEVIKDCTDSSVNLRTVPVGFKCKTSKGITYEHVERAQFGEAWKDLNTNLIWSEALSGSYENGGDYTDQNGIITSSEAAKVCVTIGGTLPSKENFEQSENNGFREALSSMVGQVYWSSSADLTFPALYLAHYFSGDTGNIDSKDFRYINHLVRCVGQ